jgi:hypothetical protein
MDHLRTIENGEVIIAGGLEKFVEMKNERKGNQKVLANELNSFMNFESNQW